MSHPQVGWQRPCYPINDGCAKTYRELIETTDWAKYGRGRDPRCGNCMAHCGYEPTAVLGRRGLAPAVAARPGRSVGRAPAIKEAQMACRCRAWQGLRR